MALIVATALRVLDALFGIAGLLLILRIVFQFFRMRWNHPVMRGIIRLTDPLLIVTNRLLGIPSYRAGYGVYGPPRADLAGAVAALIVLWATHTVIVWGLQLFLVVPLWTAHPLSYLGSFMQTVFGLLFDLYGLALLIRVLFSWIRVPYSTRMMRLLWDITEPLLAPIRSVLPPLGGIDFSPLIAYFLLRLAQQIVLSVLGWIF